jgi:hypothetical protein
LVTQLIGGLARARTTSPKTDLVLVEDTLRVLALTVAEVHDAPCNDGSTGALAETGRLWTR